MNIKAKIIPLFSLEARLRRSLRRHLRTIGFTRTTTGLLQPPDESKDTIRSLHAEQRAGIIERQKEFVRRCWPGLKNYFASGTDVIPEMIDPALELIEGKTWQSDLFRLATLVWSVPVSQGYGRRLRFLVWDKSNSKLIGIIGLGDPVFNLKVRDDYIGWTVSQRKNLLVNVMDAYVLGAVPPYSFLLCGKMIACLIRTREVCEHFARKYGDSKGVISGRQKHAKLLTVTTSSSLGRSSLYNRLVLEGQQYFRSIGYTEGWGHFHVPDHIFKDIREYLELKGHKYAGNNRFGQGPNWRLRAIREALRLLNLNQSMLRHGIAREVFLSEIASNGIRFLTGEVKQVQYRGLLSVDEVARKSRTRWIIPRSLRRSEYVHWARDNVFNLVASVEASMRERKECDVGTS